uniref:GIY-YIG endonuclease n=1 Tax=Ramaria cf. rubripermanens TaxID=2016387 RepID=UPI0022376634|nr:GIY-YIG endonuclease [Ramaria cf. rubripermanens]UYR22189.1 GIY-YIG endonuclease [Ramaria cf. rubripermanens]
MTKLKISLSLSGRKLSKSTRINMSASRTGIKNIFFGKGLPTSTLDAAAVSLGTPVYVYEDTTFTLINNKPFRSIRDAVKQLPISQSTLPKKLNSNKAFKGYYYFTKPHKFHGVPAV